MAAKSSPRSNAHSPGVPAVPADRRTVEVRCHCGSLMARLTSEGLELKCRRCKRVVVVGTDRARRDWVTVEMHPQEAE